MMDREAAQAKAEEIIEKWLRQSSMRPEGFTEPAAQRLARCVAKGLREAHRAGQDEAG